MTLKALIFDVDGTLAETEDYHRQAFNQAFAEFGIDWAWNRELYAELLKTTGGKERILAFAKLRKHNNIDVVALHARKTEIYLQYAKGGRIELRSGVADLIDYARQIGLQLAIATTTTRANVENLLWATLGPSSLEWFKVICCGEDVRVKKPDPEVYLRVLDQLGLSPSACLAIEDSYMGLKSASDAGIAVVITPSVYTNDHNFEGAAHVMKNLTYLKPCL